MKVWLNRLLCALGLSRFCAPRERIPNAEQVDVRLRQERILVRLEALGVEADVLARSVSDESV
jgi:hypothetical protein